MNANQATITLAVDLGVVPCNWDLDCAVFEETLHLVTAQSSVYRKLFGADSVEVDDTVSTVCPSITSSRWWQCKFFIAIWFATQRTWCGTIRSSWTDH